jgi:PAS domain S-box-containing protein
MIEWLGKAIPVPLQRFTMGLSLLIVDDDPEISSFIAHRIRIESPHYSIAVVGSGKDCLEYLKSNHIDCILSDYQMPGMDGMELLNSLRSQGNSVPFIFITAQGSEEVARDAFKGGANDYFTKEIGFAHFSRILNSVEQSVKKNMAERSKSYAEEALRLSEERMFKAQKMAHVGNWEWDIVNNQLYWSEEVYRIYGRDPEQFVPTFGAVREAMHPDDLEPFAQAVNAAIYERKSFEMDYRIIRPDGTERTLHTIGEVFYDPTGKPLSKTGTVQDITERKQIEESLLLFKDLLNRSNDATFVNEPGTGRFLFVNDKACNSLGYDRRKLLGLRTMDIEAKFPDQSAWDAHVSEVRNKGAMVLEGFQKRTDGTTFPVEVNVSYMILNGKDYMVAVARDITERKQAEDDLRKSEARFAEAELIANFGSWLWIADNDDVLWSNGLFNIFGVKPDEFGCTYQSYLDFVHPDDKERVIRLVSEALKGECPLEYEARIIRNDGVERIIYVYGKFTFVEGDRPARLFGTVQDITERKLLERQREDLLEIFRHDMKTPLAVITGNAEMALYESGGALGEGMVKTLESIRSSSKNLIRMLEDQVLIFNMESSKIKPNREEADIGELLLEASVNISGLARNKGLSLKREIIDGLPPAFIDRTYVLRAVTNLLQNAVNYTPAGGSIKLSAGSSGNGEEEFLHISVSDDGFGIPADEKEKVFEKYHRSANARGVEGSGLGLAIVKAVAEAHGGRVELESVEGKGSTFRLVLPNAQRHV